MTSDRDGSRMTKGGVPAGSRIVVIEDHDDTREMMGMLLVQNGFVVRTVADGLEAVALIDEFAPHAAIVDVGLPTINGYEVARRIRNTSKNHAVILIALTGHGEPAALATALEAGFDALVVKPVRVQELLEIMGSYQRVAGETA